MIDKLRDPLLTPADTARHLGVPLSRLNRWLAEKAAGEPLVHSVPPARRGWPSVPFVAVVEAHVLRSLRDLGLGKEKIREAVMFATDGYKRQVSPLHRHDMTEGVSSASGSRPAEESDG